MLRHRRRSTLAKPRAIQGSGLSNAKHMPKWLYRILRRCTMKNVIKIKRWEAGLKQYELAFLLGCSATYLSMVENNRVEATKEFKRKAAEIFGVRVDELFQVESGKH
ncbi:MAG TPA: helix-turn-helix transcriptional regulator [bacterium]|nr:helix-turn-helix transcriptional regulator [bacterium]HPN35750.1 helix-turn-helix transcriptional regulator [bacterium]